MLMWSSHEPQKEAAGQRGPRPRDDRRARLDRLRRREPGRHLGNREERGHHGLAHPELDLPRLRQGLHPGRERELHPSDVSNLVKQI